ncbi:RHS repeat-associated core domain-containing protein [Prosthecomicrobium sp. N25]|uniref:RHS repeat-associated core domain-containing protein n=1 Tax=Prosthecomicrobium sp. N25 TaxID=3129254 RepID=UPI003076E2A5
MRSLTNGTPNGTTHSIYDTRDRPIAETNGAGVTLREYIWLDDLPVAVDGANLATPTLLHVHNDHVGRPFMMTDAAQAVVWRAVYESFGKVHSITGSATLDARFPGQWFQLEAGLHYNWHRHYDPTLGRYAQPDPLGLAALRADGSSLYGYARQSPQIWVDPEGGSVPPGPTPPMEDWLQDRFHGNDYSVWSCTL